MKSLSLLLLCLISFFCLSDDVKPNVDVIAVDYPPYTSPKSPNNGSSFYLLDKYAKLHFRVSLSPLFLPPARANLLIKKGQWCLSFYPPVEDNNLSRFVPLSDDTVSLGLYRLKESTRFYWKDLNDLRGKIVALLRPKTIGKMHQVFLSAGIQLVYVESIDQGLQLVLKKRVDYAFGDNLALAEAQLSTIQKQQLQFSQTVVHTAKIGFYYNIQCEEQLFSLAQQE